MGTTIVNQEPQEQPEPESNGPAEVHSGTTPYYTISILVAIAAVFAVEQTLPMEAVAVLVGLVKSLVAEGQIWRLFTSSVVHDGIVHILFNGYALFVLGRLTETISNRSNVPIIFVLSATGGAVLSFLFLPDLGVSVGASSGIIGLLGYLTVYGYRRRALVSNSLLKGMVFNIVLITFIGVFVIKGVDNFGHLGGLITGITYGLFQIPIDLYEDPREAGQILHYAGVGSMVFIFITAAATIAILLFLRSVPFQ